MKEEIYSKIEPETLLHVVLRAADFVDGYARAPMRENVGRASDALQVSMICAASGTAYRAHRHLSKNTSSAHVTQESWVVIGGWVEASYYDLDGALLTTVVLEAGDCSITYLGGHGYRVMLGESARVYEFKSGPYHGREADKEFI